jgi:hypothetical protein
MPKLKLPELPTVEDQKTEFKLKPHGLEREIVAFANSNGGKIYPALFTRKKFSPELGLLPINSE